MADEDVDVRVRLQGRAKFSQEADKATRDVDELGDELDQLGRRAAGATAQLGALAVGSSATRVQLGPLSTTMRGSILAVGALANAIGPLSAGVLSGAEAVATLTGGAGAAGGVGLLALAQASTVASLGLGGLTDALGGNEEAARNLSPELRVLFEQIRAGRDQLKDTAQAGMLPGLEDGIEQAIRQLPILDQVVANTAATLGGLAQDAGTMFGSDEWGRDLQTLGAANVQVLDDLGHAGLFLADAVKDILTEATPLATWLSGIARDGAENAAAWTEQARASGDMARFFRDARRDLQLLGSATGHGSRGLINLFGAQDVDGTKTLRSLDQLLARFERWTESPALKDGFGDAIVAEIPDAVGAATSALAHAMPGAGATAARLFAEGFIEADFWGKVLMGGLLAKKLGLLKKLGQQVAGRAGGGPAGVMGKGGTPANPLYVFQVNATPGGGVPGRGGPGPAGRFGRYGRFIKGAGWVGAAAGAYELGDAVLNDLQRERRRTRGMTPEQIRAEGAAALRDRVPLSGERAPARRPILDAQGFPTGKFEIVAPVVTLDGVKVGKLSAQVLARRQASN